MEITESWLAQIGGWAAMKAARSLVQGGLAVVTQHDGALIRGTAGAGKIKFACGLRIRSRSDVDNLCTCPHSRRTGAMCEHSLAVALRATMGPAAAVEKKEIAKPGATPEKAMGPETLAIRGQYSVFLPEGLLQGSLREPLGVLVRHDPAAPEAENSRLAAWMVSQGLERPQTVPLSLRGDTATTFLEALGGHSRVLAGKPNGKAVPLQVAQEPLRLPLTIESNKPNEIVVRCAATSQRHLLGDWWFCQETASVFRVPHVGGFDGVWPALRRGEASSQPLRWLVEHREALDEGFQVDLRGDLLQGFHVLPVPAKFEITLEGSLQAVEARIAARFGEHLWPILPPGAASTAIQVRFPLTEPANEACFYLRDEGAERRMIARLESLGFRAEGRGYWLLSGGDDVMRFYASDLPRLRDQVTILEGDRWRTVTRRVQRILPQTVLHETGGRSGQGGDWLSMEFAYQAPDGFRLPRTEVLRMIRSGQKSVQGRDGNRYILDAQGVEELEETLRDVPLELTPDGARIHTAHAAYFQGDAAKELALPEESVIREALGDLAKILRPYQLDGVRWLTARAAAGRGGLLADDM